MPSITLKNIPPELIGRLKRRARQRRRSLTQEVLWLLEEALDMPPPSTDTDRVTAQVEAWRRLAGRWVSDQPVDAEVDAIYEARTDGREVDL